MLLKHKFIQAEAGATAVLVGVSFMLLIMVLGVVVDIGRLYTVQHKAQMAVDFATLGAVPKGKGDDSDDADATDWFKKEAKRLFYVNYPSGYLGTTIASIDPKEIGSNRWRLDVTLIMQYSVMSIFSKDRAKLQVSAEVRRGFQQNRKLELAMVLDNTGSMAMPIEKLNALKQASTDLVNILFGNASALNNLRISLVPYNTAVRLETDRPDWIRTGPTYSSPHTFQSWYQFNSMISNRNQDHPAPELDRSDLHDNPPTTRDEDKFRTPTPHPPGYQNMRPGISCGTDGTFNDIARVQVGLNAKAPILAAINSMTAGQCTRINVGLMWGWFTLSPRWQGVWSAGRSDLPWTPESRLDKAIVLMTDGENTVFDGYNVTSNDNYNGTSNDDITTAALCAQIKAQGITIYTIGLTAGNSTINEDLLVRCATDPGKYYRAPDAATLRRAFRTIADDLLNRTLWLSR